MPPLVASGLGAAALPRRPPARAKAAAPAAVQAERKDAVLAFLESCQRVENAAARYQNEEFPEAPPERLTRGGTGRNISNSLLVRMSGQYWRHR
jgi:hypothetical protein